ncbi:alpha/beta-hydrolase [Exidia glandulosa HHB12029]|uniref:Alpha/beta-hydrolase n=1 Tax=Exidia glandulosa HHB12029 TaxID=1314781 RepID=A0A165G3G6_EXIGL|nr:alpha/beta-hydrolase [Exidia glandulosa HHB12029]
MQSPFGFSLLPQCTSTLLPIQVSSMNWDLTGLGVVPPTPPVKNVPVSGTFNIEVQFCEPTRLNQSHADTLLVLVHGATYTTIYWDFPYEPETYSFRHFAGSKGFATLNVALLGHGQSEHPDPDLVQIPLQSELLNQLMTLSRNGELPGAIGHGFKRVVGLGHSAGSNILNDLIVTHPESVDGVILTGYAHVISVPMAPYPGWLPAREVIPERFGHLPDGYVTTSEKTTRSAVMYGPRGTYDPAVLEFDELHKDLATTGEFATVGLASVGAPEFRGDVFLVNGAHEVVWCVVPSCDDLTPELRFYPRARTSETAIIPDAGHDLTLHLNARTFYNTVTDWLKRHGF